MNIGDYMPDVLARAMVTDRCWIWLGSRSTKGYGQIVREGSHLQVHRIAFESEYGPIPEGLVIDHLCHDPKVCAGGTCVHRICVNPAHLAAVTNADNLSRQTPAAKTHCVRGHELDETRRCKPCAAIRTAENRLATYSVRPWRVRRWAVSNGLTKAKRGALPKAVIRAWNEAHPDTPFVRSVDRIDLRRAAADSAVA